MLGENIRYKLIEQYLKKLNTLYNIIKECKGYKFNSVSLLFVYDALIEDIEIENNNIIDSLNCSDDGDKISTEKVVLKLIDFAKSEIDFDNNESDLELLRGIENLKNVFKIICETPTIDLYY